jgi:hypothetical protein
MQQNDRWTPAMNQHLGMVQELMFSSLWCGLQTRIGSPLLHYIIFPALFDFTPKTRPFHNQCHDVVCIQYSFGIIIMTTWSPSILWMCKRLTGTTVGTIVGSMGTNLDAQDKCFICFYGPHHQLVTTLEECATPPSPKIPVQELLVVLVCHLLLMHPTP